MTFLKVLLCRSKIPVNHLQISMCVKMYHVCNKTPQIQRRIQYCRLPSINENRMCPKCDMNIFRTNTLDQAPY